MARCHELLHGAIDLHTHSSPSFFDRLLVRQRVGYLLAVRGFGDFVTGHRCLGEESPREE